ncbi:hypothetical protein BLNAU_18194 [Blattamonas nauphoetae]|uniref:Uncharacterized protein n=1 Tax=Blattamonas nauphoetae TaxID=2049346 RepID=A0ABQ9X569_9EUKA|nr:hypothetical protein BLNAU_18194 [Blattamonas nauphoetae]
MFPTFLFSTIHSPCDRPRTQSPLPGSMLSVQSTQPSSQSEPPTTRPQLFRLAARGNDVMDCVIVRIVFGDAARQSSTTSPDCSAIDNPIEAIIFAPLPISGLLRFQFSDFWRQFRTERTASGEFADFCVCFVGDDSTCVNCREIPVVGALRATSPQHHHQSSWNSTPIANEHGAEFQRGSLSSSAGNADVLVLVLRVNPCQSA